MHDFHQANIILDRARVLKPKENSRAAGFARTINILSPQTFYDQIRILFKPTVPFFKVQHRFAKIFVIGNRYVNCIHATLTHLAKDLFRPICILKVVDDHHEGCPEKI